MSDLYFDCASGISGDMVVGALLDLGNDAPYLRRELKKLPLKNYRIAVKEVSRGGVQARKFDVMAGEEKSHRHLKDIEKIIQDSGIMPRAKELSRQIFLTLGKAEAKAHKVPLSRVHFHEVGAIDSIVDVVSAAILLDKLKVNRVYTGRIAVGNGFVHISHGKVALPVPAVREILREAPLEVKNINKELVTPTGAAILKTILTGHLDVPPFSFVKKGVGAGTRQLPFPNVLTVGVLTKAEEHEKIVILETNIDDMNPEMYDYVIKKCLDAGALDASVAPTWTKKNRLGAVLSIVTGKARHEALIAVIFRETSTLGIRVNTVSRLVQSRGITTLETKWGPVRVKTGTYQGKLFSRKPEYEDCKKLSLKKNVPLMDVYREVERLMAIHHTL